MFDVEAVELPSFHTVEEILAHPQFPAARNAMLEAMLGFYEHKPFVNRLLLEAGRNVLFVVIMCLDAQFAEDDPATWPTLGAVTRAMSGFGLASPRRIADLVDRLIKTGFLKQLPAPRDRRVRLLKPSEKMIGYDQDWLVAHYAPLQVLFADPGYAPIMQRDPVFQKAQRLVSVAFLPLAMQTLARNPVMLQLMTREAGIMIVIKLLHMAGPAGSAAPSISYSDIGARFGVSRTQVRNLLEEAERNGLVRLTRSKGHLVQLLPPLIEAFDRFIADTMAGHDLMFKIANRTLSASDANPYSMQNVSLPPDDVRTLIN